MRYICTSFFLFILCCQLQATVKHLVLPGQDWDDPSTWVPFGVPTAADSVFINGLVVIPADVTARAEYVDLTDNGWLRILQDAPNNMRGALIILDAPSNGLKSAGLIENSGRITITSAADTAFLNNGVIHLGANSRLGITNTIDAQPIYNNGKIENSGVIDVSMSRLGIINKDSIINRPSGNITIEQITLVVSYAINSSHVIINEGEITVSNTSSRGMTSEILINTGEINLVGVADGGINSYDSLYNGSDGTITMRNINGSGLIINGGFLINEGDITIRNVDTWSLFMGSVTTTNTGKIKIIEGGERGIFNLGNLVNEDTISIRDQEGAGIYNEHRIDNYGSILVDSAVGSHGLDNLDTFINHTGGLLVLRDIEVVTKGSLYNQSDSYLENRGKIWIDDNNFTTHGLHNDGLIVNLDTITMSGIEDGVNNVDSLYNGPDGVIEVQAPLTVGLYNFGGLHNDGLIDIHDTFLPGFNNEANYYNGSTGTLLITNTSQGILNTETIINDGKIIIDSCSSISINSFGPIINRDTIIVSNSLDFGVELVDGHYSNSGFFSIQNVEDGNGLLVKLQTIFDNEAGGELKISDVMDPAYSSLINLGAITIDSGSLMMIESSPAVPMDQRAGSIFTCLGELIVDH